MFSMLRTMAVVTTLGVAGAPAFAEPSKALQKVPASHALGGAAHSASLTVRSGHRDNFRDARIASAVAPLDLNTLTLADFGDVDGAR